MPYPDVYLLRHGETEWNRAARLQGHLDSDLTEKGQAQAHRQGEILAQMAPHNPDLSAYSSPLGRARRTADIALRGLSIGLALEERLREISAGSWDGALLSDIERSNGPVFAQARNAFELMFLAPDGEGKSAVFQRAHSFLDTLSGPSICVTHGAMLCVLRGILLGLSFEQTLELSHEQGCVYGIKGGIETISR